MTLAHLDEALFVVTSVWAVLLIHFTFVVRRLYRKVQKAEEAQLRVHVDALRRLSGEMKQQIALHSDVRRQGLTRSIRASRN